MNHISGTKALSLLEGTTPGRWWVGREKVPQGMALTRSARTVCPPGTARPLVAVDDLDPRSDTSDADLELMAAAPALAGTVAWLYDRPAVDGADLDKAVPFANGTALVPGYGRLTPDETVDLARRLLTASDQARNAPGEAS